MRWTRRTLLKAGLIGGGLTVAGLSATAWAWFRPRPAAAGYTVLSELENDFLRALIDTYFAPGNALGLDPAKLDVRPQLDAHLAALDEEPRMMVRAAFAVVDNWPRISLQSTARLHELPRARRVAILRELDESARPELRAVGEVSRIFIGLYLWEIPEVRDAVGQIPGCAFGEEVPA